MRIRRLIALLLATCLGACAGASGTPSLDVLTAAARPGACPSQIVETMPRYHLSLVLEPETGALTGRATIRYANIAPAELREVYLRLYPNLPMYGGNLEVIRAAVDGHEVPFVVTGKGADLKVPLPRTLPPNQSATIVIDYSLGYPEAKDEFHFFGKMGEVIFLPDFYPMIAPLLNGEWRLDPSPGFGDAAFADASLYELEVTVPVGFMAILPGEVIARDAGADSVSYHAAAGPLRDIGLVIAPDQYYERRELQVGEVALRSYAPVQERTASIAALSHAAGALAFCEENLGPYPGTSFTLVRMPTRKAMVHLSGMALLDAGYYDGDRPEMEFAVAQEVARQWWGNRVANDPLRDPWIDEVLATYTAYLYQREIGGPAAVAPLADSWRLRYDEAVRAGLDAPLGQPLAAYGASARYEALLAGEGPLFVQALEELLGESGLLVVLRELQSRCGYGFLDSETINTTLARLVGPPGVALSERWGLR